MTDTVLELSPGDRLVYWGSGSPPAWRVLLALHEKGLPYQDQLVSFASGVLRTPEMLQMNPRGMVPIFCDWHEQADAPVVMYESLAILTYLETFYPGTPLMPTAPDQHGLALVRMHEANNVSVVCGELIYYLRRKAQNELCSEFVACKREALMREVALWERYLGESAAEGGRFLVGDALTLADISFFPNLAYAVRCGLQLRPHLPHLAAYYDVMIEREATQATYPPHWREHLACPVLGDLFGEEVAGAGKGAEAGAAGADGCTGMEVDGRPPVAPANDAVAQGAADEDEPPAQRFAASGDGATVGARAACEEDFQLARQMAQQGREQQCPGAACGKRKSEGR